MGADPECVELAKHFLRDYDAMKDRSMDLAYAIQAAVEEWFEEQGHKMEVP